MKTLRPHQERAITGLRQSFAMGSKRPMLSLPTGAGKTFIAASIVKMALAKNNRVTFCVPAVSLIDQTVEEFFKEGITQIGVIQSDHPMLDYSKPVQVASIQTLQRRGVPETDLVVVDEAHKMLKVIKGWMDMDDETPFIGLSATPWAKGLGKWYDDLIVPTDIKGLIAEGYLSDFVVYAPSDPDLSGVKKTAGDYQKDQLGDVMRDRHLVADVVSTWMRRGEGRPTLCFAVDCAHAAALQKQFQQADIRTGYIDAYTDRAERAQIGRQLARGEIQVVVNVETLTTGVDWDVRCIILARPTHSKMLHTQIIGRGLRTAEGKDRCIILDHASNHERLGFVTDINITELDGGVKGERSKPEKKELLPKKCASCSFMKPPKTHKCPSCGFEPEKISEVETEDGELVEIGSAKGKITPQDKQRFYCELLGYCEMKGKKEGYALAMFKNKFDEWPYRKKMAAPIPPSPETISYIRSRQIAYAKRRQVA